MSYGDDSKKKKRYAIIGISSMLLVAMVVGVTVGVNMNFGGSSGTAASNKSHDVSASSKAIKNICQPTDYKQECVKSLQATAGNATDPKELIQAGFTATMKYISDAAKNSTTLKELEKDPRASKALAGCKELMDSAIADLKQSYDKLGEFDITKLDEMLADLSTWLSATITYQETCLDGFKNTTGNAGEKMKSALNTSMKLSSNALAMVSEVSSFLDGIDISSMIGRRRLLNDDLQVLGHGERSFPTWTENSNGVRRLLQAPASKIKADVIVAKDGSGHVKTVQDALLRVPKGNTKTFVIYIKQGVYKEYVKVNKTMPYLMMIGDGPRKTRITGNKNFIDGTPTSQTSTVTVLGDFFVARDIGFENTAGAEKHQAVALRVQSDKSIFYNCAMDAYQDTLYTHTGRQFYRDCEVSGTIDFVFGDAAAVFQNCSFLIRKPMENQACIVTAQGRKERRQPSAIIIQNCTFTAHPEYKSVRKEFENYLGRPWKEYSRTIIMDSFIDDLIDPRGWMPWMGDFALKTCFYTEYRNYGPGAGKSKRAKWRGVKNITDAHAVDFTPQRFVLGDFWIKPSGVPYNPGMFNVSSHHKDKAA